MKIGSAYIDEARRSFRGHKKLAEGAFAQVSDEQFFQLIDPEANSIALIVKHMTGNMRSRFTDFLTTDGEKPDRHRDEEFITRDADSREALMQRWEEGWQTVFSAIESVAPEEIATRTVTIRGEELTVLQALNRQIAHYAYHVGQIVFLAKHLRSDKWQSLSIPRGKSGEFNAKPASYKDGGAASGMKK